MVELDIRVILEQLGIKADAEEVIKQEEMAQ